MELRLLLSICPFILRFHGLLLLNLCLSKKYANTRRRAAEQKNASTNARPLGTRAAGVGGSSGTMLKLYTDDVAEGFKVYVLPFDSSDLRLIVL